VSGANLYAGGQFTTAGTNASAYVAKALLPTPVANDGTYARGPGMSLKIRFADIARDLNGLPVTVQSVSGATNATLSSNSTYIFYLPTNNLNDSFTYTVSNGSDTATGRITVNVVPVAGQALGFTLVDGKPTMNVAGVPGYSYVVQRAEDANFTVNLTTVLTTNAPTAGVFTCVDNNPPGSQAYYRLKYNP
jgi:hypothetical protein